MRVTVGVMARAPIAGRCKTRLCPPLTPEQAAAFYRAMLEDTLSAYATMSSVRLVVMASPEDDGVAVVRALSPPNWEVVAQAGDGLGARLAHAFVTLGRDGGPVALVDSDSPTVPIAPIASALSALSARSARSALDAPRALVGPCDDGGYYLVALGNVTEEALRILSDVPWSTSRVLEVTRAHCRSLRIPLDELPTWYDVDDGRDLVRLREQLRRDPALSPRTAAWLAAHEVG